MTCARLPAEEREARAFCAPQRTRDANAKGTALRRTYIREHLLHIVTRLRRRLHENRVDLFRILRRLSTVHLPLVIQVALVAGDGNDYILRA